MLRRSARLQSKRKASTQPDLNTTGATGPPQKRIKSSELDGKSFQVEDQRADESSGDDATEFSGSSRKKTRVSSKKKAAKLIAVDKRFKKVRGRLGLLHKLATEMPLDVIFEIFGHLEPLDILRLSRTSRDLRNLLTSRSSEHVWRNARLNVEELPSLPTDLNEIQYAKLVFDAICQVCGTHCHSVYWDCRIRCCQKCARETLLPRHELCEGLSPTMRMDIEKFIEYVPSDHIRSKRGATQEIFLPSAFQMISNDYEQKVKVLNDKGESVDDEEKLAAWRLSMDTKRAEHQHYTCLCERWGTLKSLSRSYELLQLRDQRKNQIEARLIESGWGPELEHPIFEGCSSNLWDHKLIDQARPLTDRTWNQIAPTLFAWLQPIRNSRIKAVLKSRYLALKKCYDNYIFQQNLRKSGYPPLGDVIQSLIGHDIIFKTPYDQTLPEDAFDEELKKLPEFIEDWKRRKTQELVEILQKDIPEAAMDTLGLAKIVFVCESCDDFIWYPEVFQHRCYSKWYGICVPSDLDMDHGFNPYNELYVVPWNKHSASRVVFSKHASMNLCHIMQSCELNPDTAIREDLESLDDVILECKSCSSRDLRKDEKKTFMRWSRALRHMYFNDHDHSPTRVQLPEHLQQKLIDIEKRDAMTMPSGLLLTCNHCPEIPGGKQEHDEFELSYHLFTHHGISRNKKRLSKDDWSWGPRATLLHKAPLQVFLEWPVDESNDIPQV